jgi:hypothetical protein
MSGYPSGSGEGEQAGSMSALLAQLRGGQDKRINLEPSQGYYNPSSFYNQTQQAQHGYQQPSVNSAIPTPPAYNQPPHHSSAVMSPAETPQPSQRGPSFSDAANGGRISLLNLLKFQQPTPSSPKQPDPIGTPLPASREPSASFPAPEPVSVKPSGHSSDLLAALMGSMHTKPPQSASPQLQSSQPARSTFDVASPPASSTFNAASPSADTQAYLLQLLNQPKPAQSESTPHLKPAKVLTPPSKASSQGDVNDLSQALEEASLDVNLMGAAASEGTSFTREIKREEPSKTQGLFTYVNPFEQLAASSPRVRTPKNPSSASPAIQIFKRQGEGSDNKRKLDERSNISSPGHSQTRRKFAAASQSSSGPPTPLPDGRTRLEALIGIGAPGKKETTTDALSEVSGQVDRQANEAIARAEHDKNQAALENNLQDMLASKTEEEFAEKAQVTAQFIKKELDKDENSHALDDLPEPVAELVEDIVDDTAQGHVVDSWESADAEDSPVKDEEEENAIKVYSFPMKPWTSITINSIADLRPTFRDEVVMDIARLKKEFDQVDRTLVTASRNFIVYGMSKNGGIRIIRQDDGRDARLFTETHDRIFGVVVSASEPDLKEVIIGTGISGTVYWALIKDGKGDFIEESNPEMHGFALPPIQSADNDSPGGVLKTRARKSSRHPEFFAVGRGKAIHIIWPSVIMKSCLKNGKDRIVDTDKYLAQYSLKLNTGKAGKDFAFSEDDTTIVSLDKAGRVKFWDIRGLTQLDDLNRPAPHSKNMDIKEPLVTYITTPATDKAWPTSVLLIDKTRPYQKGGALRYLIVGMKQNHSLQLWDLALGKPVQEIHLPHSKESDAVCSVLYHVASGMIIVGHPTRNSIYFLHLSAPKYNLKSITQAEYMQKLASGDPSVPRPESTAVVSGMREYSLENKGTLRSLDILQTPSSPAVAGEPATQFELYAMHSKGVTCITIKQAELGWNVENKVINSVSAVEEAVIKMEQIKEIQATLVPENTESTSQPAAPTRIIPRPAAKESAPKETTKKTHHAHPEVSASADDKGKERLEKKGIWQPPGSNGANNGTTSSGAEKHGKGKRRKATTSSETVATGSTVPQDTPSSGFLSTGASRNGSASKAPTSSPPEAAVVPSGAPGLTAATPRVSEARISDDVKKILKDSFDALFQDIKTERRTQTVVSQSNQEALLRLVSKILAENVDANLDKIISNNIEKSVIPAISNVTAKAVNTQVSEQLGSKLAAQLGNTIPKELQRALPDAIGRALQQPQLLKLMSESLAKSVAFKVEEHFAATLQKVVVPAFENLALQASLKVAGEVQRQAAEQIGELERQRQSDSIKMEQLMQLVTGLTETVSSMAAAQTEFQGQFLRIQQQAASEKRDTTRNSQSGTGTSPAAAAPVDNAQIERAKRYQAEYNSVNKLMAEVNYSAGVVTWLQSGFIQELYESYFSKYNPEFIRDMNSVILLSIGSAVSGKLDDMLMLERLSYLEMVVASLQAQLTSSNVVSSLLIYPVTKLTELQDDARSHIPKVVGTWIQRLEHLFLQITTINPQDTHLKQVSNLVTNSKRIIDSVVTPVSTPLSYPPAPARRY